jgi:hypothetical protein
MLSLKIFVVVFFKGLSLSTGRDVAAADALKSGERVATPAHVRCRDVCYLQIKPATNTKHPMSPHVHLVFVI